MGSDFVRSTVYILIKIQIIFICAIIIFYTWCFAWVYVQSNALCSRVTQMVTEKNYLSDEDIETIKDDIMYIYSRSSFDTGSVSNPVMGVREVGVTYYVNGTSRSYKIRTNSGVVNRYRVQSGNLFYVTTTFSYPRFRFIIMSLLQSGSAVTVNDLARNERTTSGRATIGKYTIGMKYYPDLESTGSMLVS